MYSDFSSLPPDQEREFVVYEQKTRESEKSAIRTGGIVAGIYGLLMVIVVLSYDKPPPLISAEDIAVTEERTDVRTPDREPPTPSPAEVTPSPAGVTPTPSPAEGAAGAEAGTVAPAPKAGTTKASPTDLVKANQ